MKCIKWLDDHFEEMLLMLLLLLINIVVMYSVVMRYVVGSALSWGEEITRYMFVWSTFLSISFCIKKENHIRIDMVIRTFSPRLEWLAELLVDIIQLAFFVYMLRASLVATADIKASMQSSPALFIPMWLIYGSSVVGFGLGIFRGIQHLIKRFATPLRAAEERK
jgi:TRAP-type C4-dicarboxylate transport system permease small subunit